MQNENFNKDAKELKQFYKDFENKSQEFKLKYEKEIIDILKDYFKYINCYCDPELNIDSIVSFEEDYFTLRIFENYENKDLDFPEALLLDTTNFLKPFKNSYEERIEKQKIHNEESRLKKESEEKAMLAELKAKYES